MTSPTVRWRGGVGAAAVLAVVGLVTTHPVVVLSALIPLAFVAYGTLTAVDVPDAVTAERRIDPTPVPPGQPVLVTLRVTNESDQTLSDVRVVDGTPADLAVTRGSPREGTTLEPGESVTVRYELVARRGEHVFGPPTVRIRSLGGGAVVDRTVPVDGQDELVCRLDAGSPPLADSADRRVGQLSTDTPGRGLEFHSTREYRHGDDANRIDWRHYAKRGTLATVNYREQRAATVVVVVDARRVSRVVPGPGRPTAVELGAYAATRAVSELARAGHDVAVAVVGCDGPGPADLYWLPGGSGLEHQSRARDLLTAAMDDVDGSDAVDDEAAEAAEDVRQVDPAAQLQRVLELSPPRAQLALFSPLLDDQPVETVETWAGEGRSAVVLSPDVVSGTTVSGQVALVERRTRLARCQATGARTVDWRRGTPLRVVLRAAFAPGSDAASTAVGGGVTPDGVATDGGDR